MTSAVVRPRISRAVLWGAFGILAWAGFTLLAGGGSAQASEDDPDAPTGPLTALVTTTTEKVATTVTQVTAPVVTAIAPVTTAVQPVTRPAVEVVKPVVTQVVAPVVTDVVKPVVTDVVQPVVPAATAPVTATVPPALESATDTVADAPVVGDVAAPVLETVSDAVADVSGPIIGLFDDEPVSRIVDPLVDTITGLPIVGDIIVDSGVGSVVDSTTAIVDETTATIGNALDGSAQGVVDGLDPTTPAGPGTRPGLPTVAGPDSALALFAPVAGVAAPMLTSHAPSDGARSVASEQLSALAAPTAGAHAVASGGSDGVPASDSPISPQGSTPTSSAGHGGGSPTDGARVSDASDGPHRAWMLTTADPDDDVPSSPVADTDVSPD
ncbi:hypothetical protein OED01_16105 [Microbacterium sp. M28]|uniref:hypothetical protein n=1 Tax=Microbacterium sp. M28 TaxID=2962064 RepID=UPI0021F3D726|nr:hypothetical protein [Microbacterium sp. M28]UYO97102.1 hypothetical protein OED01_16105 [Microbacterium sp. M28]